MKKLWLCISVFTLFIFYINCDAKETQQPPSYAAAVANIEQKGNELLLHYDAKNSLATMDGFSDLYFSVYEGSGMELAVTTVSPTSNTKTESLFAQLIGGASKGATLDDMHTWWTALKMRLNLDLNLVETHSADHFSSAFLQSLTILLREGFEALLIVTALLTYLRRSPTPEKSKVIYQGVFFALLASAATAVLFATILKNAGSHREAAEGITMLIASGVLFYVSYWLFAKRQTEKWQHYIKQKVTNAISNGSTFALGLAAFLAVYREGAETILFYQALLIGNKGQIPAIMLGFGVALIGLFMLYRAMQTVSFKIPFKLFFTLTAIFLYYMAFSFIGGGILELQEAGWVDISPINHFPQLTFLGIFPAWENVGAQLLFLIPTLIGLLIWYYKESKKLPSA